MARLGDPDRREVGGRLMELGNLMLTGLLIGQLVPVTQGRQLDENLVFGGGGVFIGCYLIALWVLKGGGH